LRSHSFLLVILSVLLCRSALNVAAADVSVPRYGFFEVSFHCPDSTGNPFDPTINDVWATFDGPSEEIRTPAFWDGDGMWKARFSPEEVGEYTVTLSRNGVDETGNAITPTTFYSRPSKSPGFIHVAGPDASWQHFVFDNGSTYFPIGMDAAWGGKNVLDYPALFPKMSQYHMNFARVWMTAWDSKALDWGLTKASSPQPGTLLLDNAKRVDAVFFAANKSDVYVQLTLQHHGQFTKVVDPAWDYNPMNAHNPGGFLPVPDEFFTNPLAIELTEAKYRYIVARYAWSSHLLGFELFNEIQNDPELVESDYAAWHRLMAAYIRSIDPYHHLITTSYTDPSEALAKDTTLDYWNQHAYPNNPTAYFESQSQLVSSKPLFWGEYGAAGRQTADVLHGGLWAGIMDPLAGAPQFWFWDTVQHDNWWSEFASVINFARRSGLSTAKDSAAVDFEVSSDIPGPLILTPSLGWNPEIGNGVVTVTPDGKESGMSGISTYIQGSANHNLMPYPLTIDTDFSKPVTVHVLISSIAQKGAHLVVTTDGQTVAEQDFPASGRDRRVKVDQVVVIPAGQHAIGILNTGVDHFNLDDVVVDDVASAADVMVRRVDSKYLFWALRKDGVATIPINLTLTLPNVTSSSYSVHLYDTSAANTIGAPVTAHRMNGQLTVPIVLTGNDIAGWISPNRKRTGWF
jgi:hypothetical protein